MLFAIGFALVMIGASAADSDSLLFPVICTSAGALLISIAQYRREE